MLGNECRERARECEPPRSPFDCNLPQARQTEEDAILCIFDQGPRSPAQSPVVSYEPQKRVRIEQEAHYVYSSKSVRGASKSSAIVISPAALPARRASRQSPAGRDVSLVAR